MATDNRKVRILFLEVTASMGGVEVTTLQAASLLDRERFEPMLCCPEEGNLTTFCREVGVEVHVLPLNKFASISFQLKNRAVVNPFAVLWDTLLFFYAAAKLTRFLQENQVDLVCTKGLWAHLYGGLASKFTHLPCVWHVQEVVENRRAFGIFLRLLRWTAAISATQIVGDAQTVSAQFSDIARLSSRVQTIYNGIDTSVYAPRDVNIKFREQFDIPPDAFVVGYVARLMYGKGHHILLKAFQLLANEHPNIFLVFVGKGLFDGGEYERHLRNMVTQFGLETRVRFTGFVEHSAPAFNAFDIALHVSIEPDSPLVVMEAMASGCPLILTSVPGCEEMVRDGEILLVSPQDVEALRWAIIKLYSEASLRERLSCAARTAALKRFSLSESVHALENVFENSINSVSTRR